MIIDFPKKPKSRAIAIRTKTDVVSEFCENLLAQLSVYCLKNNIVDIPVVIAIKMLREQMINDNNEYQEIGLKSIMENPEFAERTILMVLYYWKAINKKQ